MNTNTNDEIIIIERAISVDEIDDIFYLDDEPNTVWDLPENVIKRERMFNMLWQDDEITSTALDKFFN